MTKVSQRYHEISRVALVEPTYPFGFFAVFNGHEGNPKAETRNPKSQPVGLREAGSREPYEPELRLEPLNWPPSGFGLRISFGFRASDFELWPRACFP